MPHPSSTQRDLEATAHGMAIMAGADADLLIDGYVEDAMREWRVVDATFWQRVKFRSQMIRAAAQHHAMLDPSSKQPKAASC